MTEELSSVTEEPVATAQDGVNVEVANQHDSESHTPKEINFRRLEEARDKERDRAYKAEQELAVLRDRMSRLEQEREAAARPKREKDDILDYGSYEEDMNAREQKYQQMIQNQEQKLMKLEAKAEHPDLDKVISKYGKQLSPAVAQACMNAQNPYLAAYEACRTSEAYYKDQMKDQEHEYSKRAEANAKKPQNPAKVGSKGALKHAQDYAKMSHAELVAMGDRYRLG